MIKVLVNGEWVGPGTPQPKVKQPQKFSSIDQANARRTLALGFIGLTILFVVIAIYGSIVPLQYQQTTLDAASVRFFKVINGPIHFGSKSDWVANILLFFPIGFCAAAMLRVNATYRSNWRVVLIPPACIGLSLFVEFIQIWFPPRHPSINDMVAESLGAISGLVTWLIFGPFILDRFLAWQAHSRLRAIASILLGLDLIVLLVMHAMPLDLTISPGELKHKWDMGSIHPIPFDPIRIQDAAFWIKTCWNLLYFASVGWLLVGTIGRKNWIFVALLGMSIAVAIEGIQLLALSRNCDSSDVVSGSLAVLIGAAGAKIRGNGMMTKRWFSIFWMVMLILAATIPFRLDLALASDRIAQINWLPFLDYQQQNYLAAFDEILQKLLASSILTATFILGWKRSSWVAFLICVLFFALLEILQLGFLDRNSSTTDVALSAFGARFGMTVARLLHPKSETVGS
jgi:VanZ family protein